VLLHGWMNRVAVVLMHVGKYILHASPRITEPSLLHLRHSHELLGAPSECIPCHFFMCGDLDHIHPGQDVLALLHQLLLKFFVW